MADIHIEREHALGLPEARKIAFKWAEQVADPWAKRCLLVAKPEGQSDAGISALINFLVQPSQNAKAAAPKQ